MAVDDMLIWRGRRIDEYRGDELNEVVNDIIKQSMLHGMRSERDEIANMLAIFVDELMVKASKTRWWQSLGRAALLGAAHMMKRARIEVMLRHRVKDWGSG